MANLSIRPSSQLQTTLGFHINRGQTDSQWYSNIVDETGTIHYTFAHLDQRTFSLTARINYTASPDLTFEFYAQPFVSTGTYSDVREVSATPEAESYDDRFQPFTPPPGSETAFKFSQLRTNTVLRWEYRPGSTLFVVWAHGREADTGEEARQSWGNDLRDLFEHACAEQHLLFRTKGGDRVRIPTPWVPEELLEAARGDAQRRAARAS